MTRQFVFRVRPTLKFFRPSPLAGYGIKMALQGHSGVI
jgi:hypothetical protein